MRRSGARQTQLSFTSMGIGPTPAVPPILVGPHVVSARFPCLRILGLSKDATAPA